MSKCIDEIIFQANQIIREKMNEYVGISNTPQTLASLDSMTNQQVNNLANQLGIRYDIEVSEPNAQECISISIKDHMPITYLQGTYALEEHSPEEENKEFIHFKRIIK